MLAILHTVYSIFKSVSFNGKVSISIKISLKFVYYLFVLLALCKGNHRSEAPLRPPVLLLRCDLRLTQHTRLKIIFSLFIFYCDISCGSLWCFITLDCYGIREMKKVCVCVCVNISICHSEIGQFTLNGYY